MKLNFLLFMLPVKLSHNLCWVAICHLHIRLTLNIKALKTFEFTNQQHGYLYLVKLQYCPTAVICINSKISIQNTLQCIIPWVISIPFGQKTRAFYVCIDRQSAISYFMYKKFIDKSTALSVKLDLDEDKKNLFNKDFHWIVFF